MTSSKKPSRSSPLSRQPDRLTLPVRTRKPAGAVPYFPSRAPAARPEEDTGYFALKTEILGADRVLDVYYDYAPAERGVDYSGYLDLTRVEWNGVVLWTHKEPTKGALTQEDLKLIAEDIEDYKAR